MYDDDEPVGHRTRGPSRGGVILVSVLVSAITSAGMFVGLRVATERGLFGQATAIEVPSLVGMDVTQARELLGARELLLVIGAKRADAQAAAGTVVDQSPLAKSEASRGSSVTVTVSEGALTVPELGKLLPEEAAQKLRAAGLASGPPREAPSDEVPQGRITGSDPPAGSAVGANTSVSLIVSSGPAGAQVPKLVGQSLHKAKQLLKEAGFTLGSSRFGYSDYSDPGVVLKQTPEAGALATPGSAVDLVVNEPD